MLKSTFFLIIHTKILIFAIHTYRRAHCKDCRSCVFTRKRLQQKGKGWMEKYFDFSPTQSHRNEVQQTHVQSVRELKDINIRDAGSQCPIQDQI